MEMRVLDSCELEVSALALGTWAMGGEVDAWGPVDDGESVAAIEQALDCGINLIDTAPIYGRGHAEEVVGNAIRGRRHEVILATKCGLVFRDPGDATPARCLAPDSIIRECESSLRRLHTDTIDLYQCHWPDPDVNIRDTMGALCKLLEQGKIRAIGLSNFNWEKISAAREYGPVHAVQPRFSMLQRRAAEDIIPACMEYRMGVFPYGPLEKGLLTGKFDADSELYGVRARDPEFMGKRFRRSLSIVESLTRIAKRYGKSVGQLAINWTAGYPGVTAPIVGAKRPSQVLENAGGIGWSITEDDRAEIERILRKTDGDT